MSPVNDAPVAVADTYGLDEDTALVVSAIALPAPSPSSTEKGPRLSASASAASAAAITCAIGMSRRIQARGRDMNCEHDINAREVAVVADGYCPLCMEVEIDRMRALLIEARQWLWDVEKTLLSYGSKTLRPTIDKIDAALTAGQRE